MLTLTEAANLVGITRPALFKAVKSGRVSATKDDKGQFQIDPSELFRVYKPVNNEPLTGKQEEIVKTDRLIVDWEDRFNMLQDERNRERKQLESTIEDLRQRLNDEASERRRLTMLLTHTSTPEPQEKGSTALLDKLFKRGKPTSWHR